MPPPAPEAISPGPSGPSPATWYVIVWALIALAINSMAQPVGKRCSIPNRYRMYLSSSPILCIADAGSVVLRLAVIMWSFSMGPRQASRLLLYLKSRPPLKYRSDIREDPTPALSMEAGPRIIYFILGALPAAIKLASLSGIPWSKTWGMMFLASFLVTELIGLLAGSGYGTQEQMFFLRAPTAEDDPQRLAAFRRIYHILKRLEFFDINLSIAAISAHVSLITWATDGIIFVALKSLTDLDFSSRIRAWPDADRHVLKALLRIWQYLSIASIVYMSFKRPKSTLARWGVGWPVIASLTVINTFQSMIFVASNREPFSSFWDRLGCHTILAGLCISFTEGLEFICKMSPGLGEALSIGVEPKQEEPGAGSQVPDTVQHGRETLSELLEDILGPICFLFFLGSLTVTLLWYAYAYDATGTVNPPWTEIFG